MSAYDDLRVELDNTKHVNNNTERERIVATVTAKAVVDIAESLRSLLEVVTIDAVTTALADPDEGADGGPDRHPDDEPDPSVNLGPLAVGDEVMHQDVGERLGVIASIGESEGMAFAMVDDGAGINATTYKVWLDDLARYAPPVDPFDDPAAAVDELDDTEPADAFGALKNRAR